jgi:hypothetical protein
MRLWYLLSNRLRGQPGARRRHRMPVACGLCHTDLHYIDQGVATALRPPLVLGHEATGVIALAAALDERIALEEARVFPAVATTIGDGLVDPFIAEHREIRAVRDELFAQASAGALYPGLCLRLCELILEHQQREDLMLFPSARAALDPTTP